MPVNLGGNEINNLGVKLLNETQFEKTILTSIWDAGLTSSYPGTGTSWYEWKNNNRTGTFTNGPSYSTQGGGSIFFDGSNDYVEIPTFSLGSVPWSVSFWIKTTATNQCALFSHWSGGPVYNGFALVNGYLQYTYYNSSHGWNYSPQSTTYVANNNWVYVTYSTGASATSTFTFYVNGVAAGTFTPVGDGIGSGNMGSFGMYWGWGFYSGYMATCSIHNSQLTQAQILQNFNSTRQRFGV
jgi:hypothetical protein